VIRIVKVINLFTVFEVLFALITVWGFLILNMTISCVGFITFFFGIFFIMPFMEGNLIFEKRGRWITVERIYDYWD